MKRHIKYSLAAALAAVLGATAVTGVAEAHRKKGCDEGKHYSHGKKHHGNQMKRAFMKRYDANEDGKVSQDEVDSNRAQWYARFDVDKDGNLTLEEFIPLWTEARQARIVREFQEFDVDGDAAITIEEYQEPMAEVVASRDRNGDGVLSRDDRRGKHKKHKCDQDKKKSGDKADTEQQ